MTIVRKKSKTLFLTIILPFVPKSMVLKLFYVKKADIFSYNNSDFFSYNNCNFFLEKNTAPLGKTSISHAQIASFKAVLLEKNGLFFLQ